MFLILLDFVVLPRPSTNFHEFTKRSNLPPYLGVASSQTDCRQSANAPRNDITVHAAFDDYSISEKEAIQLDSRPGRFWLPLLLSSIPFALSLWGNELYRSHTKLVNVIPILGGRGKYLEYAAFNLLYNVPLSVRYVLLSCHRNARLTQSLRR
jgi:hypothetical protein